MEEKVKTLIDISNVLQEASNSWRIKSNEFMKKYPKVYTLTEGKANLRKVTSINLDFFKDAYIVVDESDSFVERKAIYYLKNYGKTWSFYKKDLKEDFNDEV